MLKRKFSSFTLECGTDEAGRGCLCGPVTAAAVILPNDFSEELLNDSKQMTKGNREKIKIIVENEAIAFGIAHVFENEIDSINILQASLKAMHLSIAKLTPQPEFISVDGNKFHPFKNIPFETIIKGDSKFLNIAAASVLAKTYRDAYMEKIHQEFPMYQWNKNKGYPTKSHRKAIKKYGATKYHRKSFKLLPEQYRLEF